MAVTTQQNLKGLYPDQSFPFDDVVPEALINNIATIAGVIEGDAPVMRVPYVKTDPAGGFVAEGAEINVTDPELDEVRIVTRKLAILTKQSREASTHTISADLLSSSMSRSIIGHADNALLNNQPTDNGPTGLLHIEGTIDGGTLTNSFDPISDAITSIEVNRGKASSIIMDPKSWGVLSKLKLTTGELQLGTPAEQAERRLFGLPVYTTPEMPEGNLIVVDKGDLIACAGDIQLTESTDAYFTSDSIARRVTWRFGWNLVHANRMAKIKVDIPAAKEATNTK